MRILDLSPKICPDMVMVPKVLPDLTILNEHDGSVRSKIHRYRTYISFLRDLVGIAKVT